MASTQYNLDREAPIAAYHKTSMEHQHQNGLALFKDAGLASGMTALDFGCGTGNLAEAAAEIVGPTGRIIAFDPAAQRIKLAKENIAKKNADRERAGEQPLTINYYEGDSFSIAASIPADFHFDVIYSNSVLHWLAPEYRASALASVGKFLKPGGIFAIAGGSGDHPHMQDPKVEALSQDPFSAYPIEGEAKFVKKAELQAIFSALGYGSHDFEYRTNPMTFASVQDYLDWANASSSGNFLHVGYLPEGYQLAASAAIRSAYEKMADPATGKITFDSTVLYSIAKKA